MQQNTQINTFNNQTNIEKKNTNNCLRNHLTVEKFREFKMFRNLLQQMFLRYTDSMPNDINPNDIKQNDIKLNDI